MEKISLGCGVDRLSELPGNVIDSILGCLPIEDAARTSCLSKKWKDKWCSVPSIIFEDKFFRDSRKWEAEGIISYILAQHRAKAQKFSLSIDKVNGRYNVKSWIQRLAEKGIQDLTLDITGWKPNYPSMPSPRNMNGPRRMPGPPPPLPGPPPMPVPLGVPNYLEVPSDLFSCQQLTKLQLCRFVLEKPPQSFKGFHLLISLHLEKVSVATDVFENFISSCSLLEQLTVKYLSCVDHLRIKASRLKYFSFVGKVISIRFDTPVLAVLSINLYEPNFRTTAFSQAFQIYGMPPAIEKLYVQCQFKRFLVAGNLLTEALYSYSHLKTLQLHNFCFKRVEEVSCLLSFIDIFPNLEELEIKNCPCKTPVAHEQLLNFWEEQSYSAGFLDSLKYMKVRCFSGKDPELRFVQYVLANSPLLKEMTLEGKSVSSGDEKVIMGQLMRFRRASPDAEVEYTAKDEEPKKGEESDLDFSDSDEE